MSIKKETVFFVIVVLSAIFVTFKSYKPNPKLSIEAVVSKQKEALHSIYQERANSKVKTIQTNTIEFPSGRALTHALYGEIGFKTNFFMDLKADFDTFEEQTFFFDIYSDDGFVLFIDDKKICDFQGDRAYQKTGCSTKLKSGTHSMKLSYFQGGGPLGLTMFYYTHQGKKWRVFGEDSEQLVTISLPQ